MGINRVTVLELINDVHNSRGFKDYNSYSYLFDQVDTMPEEPCWIPVTERLPQDDVYVLLTVRRMDDSYNHVPFISTGYISWNHQWWWCAHDGNCKDANIDVLAWMPLPEPYKGVTDGRD